MGADMLAAHKDNPRGHYENKKFLQLNILMLGAAAGSWEKPPSREAILKLRYNFGPYIKRMVEEESLKAKEAGFTSWGFKDPRTTLTIELYVPYLDDPQFVCCYRDPREVAKSLNRRDGFPIVRGMELAKIYNDRLSSFMNNWMNERYEGPS